MEMLFIYHVYAVLFIRLKISIAIYMPKNIDKINLISMEAYVETSQSH